MSQISVRIKITTTPHPVSPARKEEGPWRFVRVRPPLRSHSFARPSARSIASLPWLAPHAHGGGGEAPQSPHGTSSENEGGGETFVSSDDRNIGRKWVSGLRLRVCDGQEGCVNARAHNIRRQTNMILRRLTGILCAFLLAPQVTRQRQHHRTICFN